jgi:2-polyprenyl-6-methoxyphenol hydroxylase-like FAD-dependent oxidoreductase
MAADLGYLKYGIFPGDAGIFSITLCASPHDDDLRRILRTRHFEAAAAALPALGTWLDPGTSEPISDVHAMANLENTRRWFVRDGKPMALGVFPVGDALIHTNPLNGRGCTLAWMNAELVAQALEAHPTDAMGFALGLDAAIEREIVPWYRATLAQDRDAIRVASAQRRGLDPYAFQRQDGSVDPRAYMRSLVRDGLLPALREDLVLLRAFTRVFNLLEAPTDLLKDPDVLQRVIAAFERRGERPPVARGPDRAEMLEYLAAVGA